MTDVLFTLGWAFDTSAPNWVEEITVKLHLPGKSRLTF